MYNQLATKKLESIIVVVDNYDIMKEMGLAYKDFFMRMARDGVSLGIYLVISASRAGSVRYNLMNSIKTRMIGLLMDKTEVMGLLGRTQWEMSEIKGRVLAKKDEVHQMQLYTTVSFDNELEYIEKLKEEIQKIAENCG